MTIADNDAESRRVAMFCDMAQFFSQLSEAEYTGHICLHMVKGDISDAWELSVDGRKARKDSS